MSKKNPNFDPLFEQNPAAEKFKASSPADAVNTLNTLTTTFQRFLDRQYKEMQKLQMSSKASDKKLVNTLNSMMGTRANMMHADQNPVGKMAKQLSTSRHQNVNNFLSAGGQVGKDRRALMRSMTKMAVETSNMLIEKFNNRAANGAGKKELRSIANQWMHNKNTFAPFVKDKYFNTVRMKYDEKLGNGRGIGKLSYIKFAPDKKDYELQFMHFMNSLRGSANDASDALENFANELGEVGNWLSPLGKAFAGTPIGDIATVFGNAEKFGKQITEAFNGNDVAGVTKSRMGTLGKWFDEIGLSKLTGGEGGGAFQRMFEITSGERKATNDDRKRDAKGRFIKGLKGDDTLFGKLGSGLGKLTSGKAFSGGKLGKGIGKVLGAAMKLPLGAVLGPVGIIAGAAIGIFKFLAKSSPILQAVESILQLFFTLFFMPIGNALGSVMLPLMESLIDWVLEWNALWDNFSWDDFWNNIIKWFETIWSGIVGVGETIWAGFVSVCESIWSAIVNIGETIWGFIMDFLKMLIQNFLNLFNLVTTPIKFVIDLIKGFFTNPTKVIQDAIGGIADAAGNALGGLVDSVQGIFGMASGGIVQPSPSGTLALLAEGGEPEAVIPLSEMENVFGATGKSIVININGDVYGMSDLESKIESVINRVSNRSAYR